MQYPVLHFLLIYFAIDLHKIDHAAKKELASAKGYPVVSLPWYPGQSSGKVNCIKE